MPTKILIVDDSLVARELVRHILESDPELEIVGMAKSGEEAVQMTEELQPDVITMDIHMPGMNGYEATRQIMERFPRPIIIVSASTSTDEVGGSFKALEAGAVAIFERPVGTTHPGFDQQANELRRLVRAMADVPVVRRWAKDGGPGKKAGDAARAKSAALGSDRPGIVAIGASTGGPLALQQLFKALAKPFPLPVVVVQHISAGFLDGFIDWMTKSTGIPIRIPLDGDTLEPGVAFVAPDGGCMTVDGRRSIRLLNSAHGCQPSPSVSHLFDSVCVSFGNRAIGVLMSGMGKDGAAELLKIRQAGGRTIAQDQSTSIVFGMPGEAVRLNAAEQVLPPDAIALRLNELAAALALSQ